MLDYKNIFDINPDIVMILADAKDVLIGIIDVLISIITITGILL